MPTRDLSKIIFDDLEKWIAAGHSHLELLAPISGTFAINGEVIQSPDLIVTNKETGRMLGIEIKQGERELPIGIYPGLKTMHQKLKWLGGDFVVISDAKPSNVLSSNVTSSGISLLKVDDPAFAITALEPKLTELAGSNAALL